MKPALVVTAALALALSGSARAADYRTLLDARLDQLKHKAWDGLNAQAEEKKLLTTDEQALKAKENPTSSERAFLRDRWDQYWNVHDYWSNYLGLVFQTGEDLSNSLRGNPGERIPFASRLERLRREQKMLGIVFKPENRAPLTMSSYVERKRVIQTAAAISFYEDLGAFDPSTGNPLK